MNRVAMIGSGFSALSAASYLSRSGFEVDVYEKNSSLGGRARVFHEQGYSFDMGPSWYWMPDIFEKFFADFEKEPSDYYNLTRLSPAYQVFFDGEDKVEIPSSIDEIHTLFDSIEPGAGNQLRKFINSAEFNYKAAMDEIVYKPGKSVLELVTPETVSRVNQFFTSIRSTIRKRFTNPQLIKILEFPVLFLGAKPEDTPAFYNFMNYADLVLGTWYPMGGMYKIVEGMTELARSLGTKFHTSSSVDEIVVQDGEAKGLIVNGEFKEADFVLSGADYHHTETLLSTTDRQYSEKYWGKRTFAPSALIFYVGVKKKLNNLLHHNLFFDEEFDEHAVEIYDEPKWPNKPLFYVCAPSVTDSSVAPEGHENLFFLVPLAPGLEDSEEEREKYFDKVMERLERRTGNQIREAIDYKRSFCVSDFKSEYNSYKGNAYGMANTLRQTAFLRPKIQSSKVSNLFFTGQLTVPGPGVPPALISGKISSQLIINEKLKHLSHADI